MMGDGIGLEGVGGGGGGGGVDSYQGLGEGKRWVIS